MTHDLVVVGAGITGLAAAWEAYKRGADVVVLEASERPGGKLRTSPVAGIPIDESADAFLARVPEAVDLCTELGLLDELVAPATSRAYIWAGSTLRPIPQDQLLGIPTDLDGVAASGILSPDGLARAAEDASGRVYLSSGTDTRDQKHEDVSVGELVRGRLGDEVHELLVAPLIGGIWAGDADRLSVEVAAPAIAEARRRDPSLIHGARAVRAAAPSAGATPTSADAVDKPVFLAPRSGMERLVDALVERLGDRVRLGQPVEKIEQVPLAGLDSAAAGSHPDDPASPRNPTSETAGTGGHTTGATGWRIQTEEGPPVLADAVVIATSAPVAARLLPPHSPRAADVLANIEHAPVTLTTLAVRRDQIDHPLDGSGFLVPPSAGLLLTACSWASSKWEHLAGGKTKSLPGDSKTEPLPGEGDVVLLRASAGRDGDERAMQLSDEELLQALLADLRLTVGLRAEAADVIDIRVRRWPQGFPQPRPGHLKRIADLERALAEDTPNLAAAGAWARGVGIPACIRSGRNATLEILKG